MKKCLTRLKIIEWNKRCFTRKIEKRVLLRTSFASDFERPFGKNRNVFDFGWWVKNIDYYTSLQLNKIIIIYSKIANKLELKGHVEPLIATWYNNNSVRQEHSWLVSVKIYGSLGRNYSL